MRVIGLTGGIASGKSTVARMLAELGAPVIDADQIAREVVEPGQPALDEVVRAFGAGVLAPDGTLDRKKLGARVFADPTERRRLNAIVHPRIALASQARLAELRAAGAEVAIYEAALLVENGIHHGLDGLIVVKLDAAQQLERVRVRDRLGDEEAEARLAAQAPLAEKLAAADYVVDNQGSLEETRRQVADVWQRIRQAGPKRQP